jgi:hypothetical protein
MERHGYARVTYIDKRCFSAGSNAADIAVDTFIKAYEFLHHQMARQRDMASHVSAMCYSRFQCLHFRGAHTRADRGSRAFLAMALAMLSLASGNTRLCRQL